MSATLNLIDRLLTMGRNLHELQRTREALAVLGRLAAFESLPADVAEETQVRLAEIHLHRRRHKRARRHLTVALLYRPDCARYHFLMASALDVKADGNLDRAADHYRKSLEFDPQQPNCLALYGLLDLRRGNVVDGLAKLRKAAELSPDDPAIVGKLVKGLRLAERFDEALTVLRAARFRNPRGGRFTRMYNDCMFRWLRRRQRVERRSLPHEEPVVLPFLRVTAETQPAVNTGTIVRIDPAAPPSGPHTPHRPARWSDRKHG
jgi:tetratricopeptide (TPR) repeat protein